MNFGGGGANETMSCCSANDKIIGVSVSGSFHRRRENWEKSAAIGEFTGTVMDAIRIGP